jgi:hypothetical protein
LTGSGDDGGVIADAAAHLHGERRWIVDKEDIA